MTRVIGMFAKEPEAGRVKTRLAAILGSDPSVRLYDAFLRDSLARLRAISGRRVVAFTPASAKRLFGEIVGDSFELEEQVGRDLGVRMAGFFERQFACGAERVALVGSDTPHLPVSIIERAFELLGQNELVLGPSEDGGYYLIGMSRMIGEVFTPEIAWSSSLVFEQTVRVVRRLGTRFAVLEKWYDLDRAEDVSRLWRSIAADRRAGRDPGLPNTEAVLRTIAPYFDSRT